MLPRPPFAPLHTSLEFNVLLGTSALFYGCPSRGPCGCSFEQSDAALKILANGRNMPCHICSGGHRFMPLSVFLVQTSVVFSMEGWHFSARSRASRQTSKSCHSTAFRLLHPLRHLVVQIQWKSNTTSGHSDKVCVTVATWSSLIARRAAAAFCCH